MHCEAAEASGEILTVDAGERVRVNGEYGDWMLCLYNDRYGWFLRRTCRSLRIPTNTSGKKLRSWWDSGNAYRAAMKRIRSR